MGKLFSSLIAVTVVIVVFATFVFAVNWLTDRLPRRYQERAKIALFVGPALLFLLGGLVIPAIRTAALSLFTGEGARKWGGLENYKRLFTERDNLIVLRNNLWWAVFGTLSSTLIGLTVARLSDKMKGESIAKSLIFLPMAISLVGAGIVWKFIYAFKSKDPDKQFGLLNQIWIWLDPVLPGKQVPQQWLLDKDFFGVRSTLLPGTNTLLLIVVFVWIQAGFATVVFSAAIKGVPDSLVEAARIDGATERQAFFKIVIPYIRPTIITVLTTTVIAVLKVFDIVQAMTNGNFETDVLANDMYNKSFKEQQQGYGAALAVVIFILVIPIVWINARNQRELRENA